MPPPMSPVAAVEPSLVPTTDRMAEDCPRWRWLQLSLPHLPDYVFQVSNPYHWSGTTSYYFH